MSQVIYDIRAVVVGDVRQGGIGESAAILKSMGVAVVNCRDAYAAVSFLVRQEEPGRFVIIGRLGALAVENMRLFSFASRHTVYFICLLAQADFVDPRTALAMRAGVYCVGTTAHIKAILDEIAVISAPETADEKTVPVMQELDAKYCVSTEKVAGDPAFRNRMAKIADRFFLTPEEQKALKVK